MISTQTEDKQDRLKRKTKPRKLAPGLRGRVEAAAFLGVGVSTLDSLARLGDVPKAIRLSGKVCWSRVELAWWCAYGCPNRATWATLWPTIRTARIAKKLRGYFNP